MSLITVAQNAIIASFNGPLKEFLKECRFDFFSSEGEYDAENDTSTPVYAPQITKTVPVVRVTTEDMQKHGVEAKTAKIIVPGNWLPQAMETSDRVLIDGVISPIRKTVGVPGDVVYLIFVFQT